MLNSNKFSFVNIPLEPEQGEEVLWPILGNRRVLKVMRELSSIPEEEASCIVSEALEKIRVEYQKKTFYNSQSYLLDDSYFILTHLSLYNRQILAIGMIRTDENKYQILERMKKEKDLQIQETKLVSYNALVSTIESGRFLYPADPSKGTLTVKNFDKMSDEDFEYILHETGFNQAVSNQ